MSCLVWPTKTQRYLINYNVNGKKQHIRTFEKLEPQNVWYLCLKSDLINRSKSMSPCIHQKDNIWPWKTLLCYHYCTYSIRSFCTIFCIEFVHVTLLSVHQTALPLQHIALWVFFSNLFSRNDHVILCINLMADYIICKWWTHPKLILSSRLEWGKAMMI